MEYVFGTRGDTETLRVKSDTHTNLTGYLQIKQVYPDQTILDNFHIIQKLDESEDADGICYDWYEIDKHYRNIDKTEAFLEQIEQLKADNDLLKILLDIPVEEENANEERI